MNILTFEHKFVLDLMVGGGEDFYAKMWYMHAIRIKEICRFLCIHKRSNYFLVNNAVGFLKIVTPSVNWLNPF